jgi:hypothetical protein
MLIFNVSLVFAALRTNPFHFFIVAFEQLLFIRKKPKMNVATRVCRIKPQLIRSIVLVLSLGYACELLLGEICYRAFPSMYIHPLRRNTDQQVKVQISRVSQAFHVVRPLQSLGLRVQTFLEFGGLLCEALVARLDRFVQTEDVAPVIFGARIMALLDGTVKCKIKAADLAEVVSLQVGGDAGHRRSLVGIVHLIEVFDRVFHHPRFLGQDIPQEFFHDLDLVITTFLWQSILKGGDEFHGKVSIFRLDA